MAASAVGGSSWRERLQEWLFTPVDAASLALFRMTYGALLVLEVWRYMAGGWIHRYYLEPQVHFKYFLFDWVQALPGAGLYWVFGALGAAGALVAVGLFYRAAAVVCFLGCCYMFLLEQAHYLNHIYLLCLVSFLMCFVGANREWSLDRLLFGRQAPATVAAWNLWLLRFQMFVVYFYAGIAKLNPDWLRGEPVRMWLAGKAHLPLIGGLLGQEWTVWLVAYVGVCLDLSIGFLLLWRRTQLLAVILAALFHAGNSIIFKIGIFPYFAMALTLLFLDPDWPRALLPGGLPEERETNEEEDEEGEEAEAAAPAPVPVAPVPVPVAAQAAPRKPRQVLVLAGLGLWAAVQLLLPLRHWLYPGDVTWTEEGHRFSWRMKLRDKRAQVMATIRDPATGQEWRVDPARFLPGWQAAEMGGRPDMLLQFAHFLRDQYAPEMHGRPEVRLRSLCSLNGRPPRDLIDPTVDLAAQRRSLLPARWILRH